MKANKNNNNPENEFNPQAVFEEMLIFLHKKFPSESSDICSIFDFRDLGENAESKIEMLNYLLSLRRTDFYDMIWKYVSYPHEMYAVKLYGKIYTLNKKRKTAKDNCYNIKYNATPSIQCSDCSLVPMNKRYSSKLCKYLYKTGVINFYVSIRDFNSEDKAMFAIINAENELVGEVCLEKIKLDPAYLKNTYNISYYIYPKYRRSGYAFQTCQTIIDKAFKGEILEKVENKNRIYTFNIVPMNVKQIFFSVNDKNVASKKLAEKLGAKNTGYVNNFDDEGKLMIEKFYSIIKKTTEK